MDTQKRRGRPPKPDALTPAERQKAYRARMAAAGKLVRVVRTDAVPDFDPAIHVVVERAFFAEQRENYHNALLKIEILQEDRQRLDRRVAELEAELKRAEQANTLALKDVITLKQQIEARPKARRTK